jgi:hypothetical protein
MFAEPTASEGPAKSNKHYVSELDSKALKLADLLQNEHGQRLGVYSKDVIFPILLLQAPSADVINRAVDFMYRRGWTVTGPRTPREGSSCITLYVGPRETQSTTGQRA